MKKRNIILTWIITVLFLLLTGWYGAVLYWSVRSEEDIPFLVKGGVVGIIFLILLPVMIMMVVTAVQRKKEIEREDEDDLSQY